MTPEELMVDNNQKAEADTSIKTPTELPESVSQGVRKNDGLIRRIVVDRQACIGAGSCIVVAEKLYQLDQQNLAYIVDPDSYDQETVKLSAESCPVLAIHLFDAEGNRIFPE